MPARAFESSLPLITYVRRPARRLPCIFRQGHDSFFPETRDDILDGPRRKVRYRALVLENEHLRLTVLPELGGKLWSLYDKRARAEVLHVPDVVKPGLISRPGAWVAGGMEFNFPAGHHINATRPVACRITSAGPEEAAVAIALPDTHTGMRMDVELRLAAGEARFSIGFRLANPTALSHRWYQWTNVGVTCHEGWQFLSKARWYFTGGAVCDYPVNDAGTDISWWKNRDIATDSFMIGHCEDFFGCYDHRRDGGIVHVSPWRDLRGKKYFTWGRSHKSFDSERIFTENGADYVEIQTGPLESQMDYEIMAPGASLAFESVWFPFRKLGGLEWASRDLAFAVRGGRPWLYPAVDCNVEITIGGKRFTRALRAGSPASLPARVAKGTRVGIAVNGRLEREFSFPLVGRQEAGAPERITHKHLRRIDWDGKTAPGALEAARRMVLWDAYPRAIQLYRLALKKNPALHEARLGLAEALWHTADFAGGARELRKLARTPLAAQARSVLSRLPAARAEFMKPVLAAPEGPARDRALAENLAGRGGFEAAARVYRRIAARRPKCWRARYGLAQYEWQVRGRREEAVRHALKALALRPGDRDLVIELAPLFMWARRYDLAVKTITDAPRSVHELSINQKMLALALFELGRFEECWKIVTTRRLHQWEGETAHYDCFVSCGAVLAERALARGDARGALRYAETAAGFPPELGLIWRPMGQTLPAYWRGLALERLGRVEEARGVWRAALDAADDDHRVAVRAHRKKAFELASDELGWSYGMCAMKLGERARVRQVLRSMERLRRARLHWGIKSSDFFEGVRAELAGRLAVAAGHFRLYAEQTPAPMLTRLHLAALEKGHRRGELA